LSAESAANDEDDSWIAPVERLDMGQSAGQEGGLQEVRCGTPRGVRRDGERMKAEAEVDRRRLATTVRRRILCRPGMRSGIK